MHGLEALCGDADGDFLAELGDEKGLRLKVYLATALAYGVVLGRTDAVRVPTSDLGLFTCDITNSGHIRETIPEKCQKSKENDTWQHSR